jgi:hypothetical protein
MTSKHLSVRLAADTLERLDAQSRRAGQSRSQLAKTLLDEGLRMAAHPGIVFRAGPAGRRPGLVGGPDIWEVARVFRETGTAGHQAVARTVELTGLTSAQVLTALRYYAAYGAEIDDWIARVDEESARAEAGWQGEQALLGR